LLPSIDAFFSDIEIRPSVLHGDLWSGNLAVRMIHNTLLSEPLHAELMPFSPLNTQCCGGEPVIFDPATYYG
jgi:fructosamine-3-kinase